MRDHDIHRRYANHVKGEGNLLSPKFKAAMLQSIRQSETNQSWGGWGCHVPFLHMYLEAAECVHRCLSCRTWLIRCFSPIRSPRVQRAQGGPFPDIRKQTSMWKTKSRPLV